MQPLIETISNSKGQSFLAKRYGYSQQCQNPGWHIHPEYELVLVKSGSGIVHVGGYLSKYEDGLLILLGPYLPHMPFDNQEKRDNIEVVVQFEGKFVHQHLAAFPEFQPIKELCIRSHSALIFGNDIQKEVENELLELVTLSKAQQLSRLISILLKLSETADYFNLSVRGINIESGSNHYARVNKVYDHVSEHYSGEIRLEDAADVVGLTKNSFCRLFKKVTRKSFIQFVNEYRINKAVELIHLKNSPISDIMYAVGYNDPSFFNRQFKKLKGQSPSSYRSAIWHS